MEAPLNLLMAIPYSEALFVKGFIFVLFLNFDGGINKSEGTPLGYLSIVI